MSWRTTRASRDRDTAAEQVAVLDLGSNSWRLVVFSYAPGSWWKRTDELYETVRIGAGLAASGRLSPEAIERGLETLTVFSRFLAAHRLAPNRVHAIATSAIRDAENQAELLRLAHERSGIEIRVLSAAEEARLGYVAAVNTTTLTDGAVVDLGGGSLQLIEVGDRRAAQLASFPLGAVRLTEMFLPGDGPARKKELNRLRSHVSEALASLEWLPGAGSRLVGIGGAARNLAAAAQDDDCPVQIGVQGHFISGERLGELVTELAGMTVAERREHRGIKPGRGDIILAAAATLHTVVEEGGFHGLEVTEAGLREGAFLEGTLLAGQEPLLADVRAEAVRNLAVQYESDLPHSEHVAELALQMHDSLVAAQLISPHEGERELLWAAALLHDVGMTISYDDHHKHSRYLILGAELPGFDPRERALIAQICRYHRKGNPKLGDLACLTRDGDEDLLGRCATVLRLAEHLERGQDGAVERVWLQPDGDEVRLEAIGDLTLPRWSLERYGDGEAFSRVFDRRLRIG